MKKQINTLNCRALRWGVAALLMFVVSVAAKAYDFTAENADGVTIYYNILNSTDRTCKVTYLKYDSSSNREAYSGVVSIPETVTYNGTTYSVTEIDGYAFGYCTGLTEITIPNSVTSIGSRAFSNCTGLTEITIPNSVTSIGSRAFSNCTGLTEVNFNAIACTSVGSSSSNRAFNGCTNISSVNIGEAVTILPDYLFLDCTGLTEVNFNAVACTSAGSSSSNRAFNGCTNIYSVNVGEAVTMLPDKIFCDCTGLTEVNFNAIACTSVGSSSSNSAFYNRKSISSVNIGEAVTLLPDYLFCNCTGITEINFNATTCTSAGSSSSDRAFCGCENVSTFNFGDNVTIIPSYLCYDLTNMAQVAIPQSVTLIGDRAFYNCTDLREVNFNATACTSAGSSSPDGAFDGCENVSAFNFGDNVTIIPSYLCYGLTGLTEITIPQSVTLIGDCAFNDCTGLTHVNFNAIACTSAGSSSSNKAFYDCNNITTFNFGDNVTIIPEYLCENLTRLTGELIIPNSVTSIGDYAFRECTGLTSTLNIPNSVTSIGSGAFYECRGLTGVTFGNCVKSIGDIAFYYCTELTEVNFNATACTSAGSSSSYRAFYGCNNITTFNFGDNVTLISDYLCGDLTGLTQVTIPNSVTAIGSYAFGGCTGLTSVTIPESVTSIGEYAFEYCSGLTEINIPEGVTEIGNSAFYDCTGLAHVNFNATACTSAGSSSSNSAFYGCTNISSVNIGEAVTTLPNYLFRDCTGLREVNFNATVCTPASNYTSDSAFYGCENITTFNFGDNVTIIPDYLCYGLTGLTSVTIPNSVTSIGSYAFFQCSGLTDLALEDGGGMLTMTTSSSYTPFTNCPIETLYLGRNVSYSDSYSPFMYNTKLTLLTIGNSVTSMGESAFYGCTGLTQVTIPNSVISIGGSAFRNCTGLTQVTIGNSVTEVGDYTFSGCTGLTSITIPNSVISIGSSAFRNCTGLTQVSIGESVAEIGSMAFISCHNLMSIYSLNPEPPTCSSFANGVFYNVNKSTCTLYVPEGSLEAYSTADQWHDFLSIVEMDMTPVRSITADGNAEAVGYYTADGKQVPSLQRGINIIRYSDGTTKKVLIK